MKIVVNINQKIGQPNYGSFGAGCSFEMDVEQALLEKDPQLILAHCKLLGDLARAGVERELDLQRRHVTPADPARADDSFETDDGPETRQRPARGRDNRPPDNRSEDRRREDFEDRQRGYREYVNEAPPRDDRPARYEDGGSRSDRRGGDGPPRNARQFLGWLGRQDRDVQDRVKRQAKAWGLPSMMKEWSDTEAGDMYHEITSKRESASHRNGSANGNGRGGY
jgi:hypothetical protein